MNRSRLERAVYYYLRLVVVMFMQPARATGAAGAPGTTPAAAPLLEPEESPGAGPLVIALSAAGVLLIGLLPDRLLAEARDWVAVLLRGIAGG